MWKRETIFAARNYTFVLAYNICINKKDESIKSFGRVQEPDHKCELNKALIKKYIYNKQYFNINYNLIFCEQNLNNFHYISIYLELIEIL